MTTITTGGQAVPTALKNLHVVITPNSDGTLNVLLGPKLLAALDKAGTGISACAGAKVRKRQSACGMTQFINNFANNIPIQEIDAQLRQLPANRRFWNPNDINAIIRAIRAGGALTGAAVGEAALPVAGVALAVVMYDLIYNPEGQPRGGGGGHKLPEVVNISPALGSQTETETEQKKKCPKDPASITKLCYILPRLTLVSRAAWTQTAKGVELMMKRFVVK